MNINKFYFCMFSSIVLLPIEIGKIVSMFSTLFYWFIVFRLVIVQMKFRCWILTWWLKFEIKLIIVDYKRILIKYFLFDSHDFLSILTNVFAAVFLCYTVIFITICHDVGLCSNFTNDEHLFNSFLNITLLCECVRMPKYNAIYSIFREEKEIGKILINEQVIKGIKMIKIWC